MNDPEILLYLSRLNNCSIHDNEKKVVKVNVDGHDPVFFTFYKSVNPSGFRVVFDSNLTERDVDRIRNQLEIARAIIQRAWHGLKRKKQISIKNVSNTFTGYELFFREPRMYSNGVFWAQLVQSVQLSLFIGMVPNQSTQQQQSTTRTIRRPKKPKSKKVEHAKANDGDSDGIPREAKVYIDLVNKYL